MDVTRRVILGACFVALLMAAVRIKARTAEGAGRKEIEAFNKRYLELHEKMDTAGILALWAEDGVDLMPGNAPMIGRNKVSAWVEDIVAKMPGYKMAKQEMEFHDIQVCGDWASEWATNINWCSHRTGSRSSKATARWRWYCIARLTASGKFSKRCGTRRRNRESRARKQ